MTRCGWPGCAGELDSTGCCWVCLRPPPRPGEVPPEEAGAPPGSRTGPTGTPDAGSARPGSSGGGSAALPGRRPGAPDASGAGRAADGPWWGLNLVEFPEVTGPTPEEAVRDAPEIPADRRVCAECGRPVGVGHDGQPALLTGRCPYDRTPYSFVPPLRRGDLLAERYRVEGCIGYGGFGWVHLAWDERLDGRPVALKGLINPRGGETPENVRNEKRFLITLRHEDIVRILDFVTGPPGAGGHDYIVMEYVPGRPLTDPELPELSAEHVIGYLLRVLRVFHYLHEGGYLFCDLKPGNLMAHGTDLTLIDLGSVREAGTPGIGQFTQDFAAPELPVTGPTVATDLYTVGATLERLCSWHGTGWTGEPPSSLRWFTERATQRDPGARFGSAAEMAGQLSGVLRDVVTRRTGRALPAPSSHFARATTLIDNGLTRVPPVERWLTRAVRRAAERGECAPLDTAPPRPGEAAAGLPDPHPDPADAAAAFLTTQVSDDLPEAIRQLTGYQVPSREVHLALFRARLRSGDLPGAHRALLAAATGTRDAHPVQAGWRRHWHDGLLALAERRFRDARASFTAAARQLPGETAPRLALAVCAECVAVGRAELEAVAAAYLAVWHTDPWYESAALGYGRVRARLGDRAEAVRVLSEVPSTSPHYRAVRTVALRVLATPLLTPSGEILPPGPAQLADSAARLTALPAGDPETRRLAALVDEARLAASGPDRAARASARAALEGRYRALAGQARDAWARTVLIDLANAVRPRTPR